MRPSALALVLAACGLAGCGQMMPHAPFGRVRPESLEDLVRTIDTNPDWLHAGYTPSVHKLIEVGDPAIPRMLDLMLLDGDFPSMTRENAQTVLNGILSKKCGFVSGRGWSESNGSDRANALWASLGNLDWKAPLDERERAVKLWREWYAKGCPLSEG
jgi:hypothetical protein